MDNSHDNAGNSHDNARSPSDYHDSYCDNDKQSLWWITLDSFFVT